MPLTKQELEEIRSAVAACFDENTQPLTMSQAKAWIAAKYASSNFDMRSVHGQIRAACVNKHYTRVERRDAPKIIFYDAATRTYRPAMDADPKPVAILAEDESTEPSAKSINKLRSGLRFSEAELRDNIAADLDVVEEGMQLWSLTPPSVEFPLAYDDSVARRRRIDILARDVNGIPVIFELKLRRAHDKVIGQALLYRSMLNHKLGVERVRIILVASAMTQDLRFVCDELEDVSLFEYKIAIKLLRVAS